MLVWRQVVSRRSWRRCVGAKNLASEVAGLGLELFAEPEMIDEKDVGIVSYANSCPGFRGVLKQRYADFVVNEVDLDGNVAHLTSLEAPPEDVKSESLNSDPPSKEDTAAGFSISEYEVHFDAFKVLAGEANAGLLRDLLQRIADGIATDDASTTLLPDADKAHRTQVHTFFREKLPLFITDTVSQLDGDNKCVRIIYNDGSSSSNRSAKRHRGWKGKHGRDFKRQKQETDAPQFDRRGGNFWPPERKKFCQFYLYKENKTTQSALMIIAQKLGTKGKNFGFAGTKDKRAVTTQRVTIYKYSASKLAAINKSLFGIKVGNFSYVDKGLVLGDLSGNRFNITLRDVVAESDSVIENACKSLGKIGFINYYGLQRFGNGGVATHAVGAKLLRGEWKGAVELILQPREGEQKAAEDARKAFLSKGPAEALKHMPHHMIAERSTLIGLKKNPENFLQAIDNIPRPMRMMYVHSYQSYLWNNATSYRLQKYGIDAVIEGDLVYCQDDEVSEELVKDHVDSNEVVDVDMLEADVDLDLGTTHRKKVKHVTRDDIISHKYTIADVVLPLPGFTTVYPANDVADVYQNLAKEDSLDLKSSTHKVKEFSIEHLSGGYRHVLVKLIDFEWKISRYNDATKPLAKTDLDKLLQQGSNSQPGNASEGGSNSEPETASEGGSLVALQVQFTLPVSAYATMALRELMKMSTSVAVHKSMTQAQDKGLQEQQEQGKQELHGE